VILWHYVTQRLSLPYPRGGRFAPEGWPVCSGIRTRLRYGFKAAGEKGYYGYKWKDKITEAELLVWCFSGSTPKHIEAIEAELVYFIREKTGQWPKYQMEIHFHGASESEKQVAKSILKECLRG